MGIWEAMGDGVLSDSTLVILTADTSGCCRCFQQPGACPVLCWLRWGVSCAVLATHPPSAWTGPRNPPLSQQNRPTKIAQNGRFQIVPVIERNKAVFAVKVVIIDCWGYLLPVLV